MAVDLALDRIAVMGAGAWGTALANTLARAGRAVTLIARDEAAAATLRSRHESPRLPGVRLEDRVAVTADITAATGADAALLVVPAQSLRAAATALAPALKPGTPAVACAKGIE